MKTLFLLLLVEVAYSASRHTGRDSRFAAKSGQRIPRVTQCQTFTTQVPTTTVKPIARERPGTLVQPSFRTSNLQHAPGRPRVSYLTAATRNLNLTESITHASSTAYLSTTFAPALPSTGFSQRMNYLGAALKGQTTIQPTPWTMTLPIVAATSLPTTESTPTPSDATTTPKVRYLEIAKRGLLGSISTQAPRPSTAPGSTTMALEHFTESTTLSSLVEQGAMMNIEATISIPVENQTDSSAPKRRRIVPVQFGVFDAIEMELSDDEGEFFQSVMAPNITVPRKLVFDGMTTSEDSTSCGTVVSETRATNAIEMYISHLMDQGPMRRFHEVNDSLRLENIWESFLKLDAYQTVIDKRNGELFTRPNGDIGTGSVLPTSVGQLVVGPEITWAHRRPINPLVTSRQYFIASLAELQTTVGSHTYLQLKTSDLNSDFLLRKEFLILQFLSNSRVAAVSPIYVSGVPRGFYLESRFSVLSVARAPTLYDFFSSRIRYNPLEILGIGRELLRLLHELHSYGIVHGSLSGWTVVFGDTDGAPNLALTEFEFAEFIKTKSPLLLVERYRAQMPWDEVSPFHHDRLSRRDDLIRFMEILARLLFGPQFDRVMHTESTNGRLFDFKMYREYFSLNGSDKWQPWRNLDKTTRAHVKLILGETLDYVRSLGIDDDPAYIGIDKNLASVIQLIRCAAVGTDGLL